MGLKSIYNNNQVFQHLRNLHYHLAAVTSELVGIFACCFHCCAQKKHCNLSSYGIYLHCGLFNCLHTLHFYHFSVYEFKIFILKFFMLAILWLS